MIETPKTEKRFNESIHQSASNLLNESDEQQRESYSLFRHSPIKTDAK